MAASTAKKGVAVYLDVVAVVLAVAGIITMFVSGTMAAGYEFDSMPLCLVACVVSVVLVVVAVMSDLKRAEKGPGLVAMFATGVAIFLLAYCGIQVVATRALMISGLFSWNSMNTTGWSVFYVAVASAACLVVSAVVLTVGSFLPMVKQARS